MVGVPHRPLLPSLPTDDGVKIAPKEVLGSYTCPAVWRVSLLASMGQRILYDGPRGISLIHFVFHDFVRYFPNIYSPQGHRSSPPSHLPIPLVDPQAVAVFQVST